MGKVYKWGIIGPGKIAEQFATALSNVPGSALYAVASRDLEKSKQFAEKYSAKRYYGSYEAIAQDDEVDVIYISTPHTFHHAHAIFCLDHKKPVVCEKPMSVTYSSTQAIVAAARQNNIFLMEGMWTRFFPAIVKALALINEDAIGEVKYLQADFGFSFPFDPKQRLYNVELGGGSLLDVGVYPLFLALSVLGEPNEIKSVTHKSITGADETTNVLLYYNKGSIASTLSSIVTQTPGTAVITGTKGSITIPAPWHKPTNVILKKHDNNTETFSYPYPGPGFEYEIMEVMNCLGNGLTESRLLPLDFSLQLSKIVSEVCRQCNLHYELPPVTLTK